MRRAVGASRVAPRSSSGRPAQHHHYSASVHRGPWSVLQSVVQRGDEGVHVEAREGAFGVCHSELEVVPYVEEPAEARRRGNARSFEDCVEVLEFAGEVVDFGEEGEGQADVDVAEVLAAVLE
eukprot:CAMPEP_0118913654 /NCGR_PEP_ID=MMETSP1166-20130328/14372_1 /TAXON_ID=1104430 /ORGANISM="Chrysoreinhardia sp, Strain CCMP3193" /LENGTH=122 /DNA_ID=CAMNT_0006853219 /DNA_START=174 /DNA_END=540 /DNA_ORIENTATION=+